MRKLLIFSLILLASVLSVGLIRADDLEDVTKELDEQKQQLTDLEKRKEQLAQVIASASFSLAQVSTELDEAEADLAKIEKELSEREKTLKQWETTRNTLIREFYKESRVSPFEIVFSADSFLDSTRQLQYYQDNLGVLKENISVLSGEISTFKENKAKAEELRNDLADLRNQYSAALAYSRWQHSSASSQLAQVKASIKGLTAKQEQLILAKFAASATSETVGDTEPLSEPLPNPSFTPAFMVASYGVPHRVGMSQYGALGRANSGQSAEQILAAYYSGTALNKSYNEPSTIAVNGSNEYCWKGNDGKKYCQTFDGNEAFSLSVCYAYVPGTNVCYKRGGKMNFTEYLKHLYEVPSYWHVQVLRAQAVAARSYAIRYGSPICPSQACQVVKFEINASSWQQAVSETSGWVVTYGGSPINAYYSSTAGGYTLSSQEVWGGYRPWALGIKDYGPAGAYDGPAYVNNSWYHTGWGSRNCNVKEYNPWLTKEELADIFNAALLYQKSSNYTQYLSPIDGCIYDSGWSADRVKAKLVELGTQPINFVSAIVAGPNPPGANTVKVYITSDRGPLEFNGSTFRAVFNLRARGYLVIKTGRFDFEAR